MRKSGILIIVLGMALAVALPQAVAQQSEEQMAAYYYDHGEMEQAAQLYETLLHSTANRYYYQRLLSTYINLERYRDALRLVQRQQKANPKELRLYVDEGEVYLRQKQEKKALRCFDHAIEGISTNLQPVPDLAQAFEKIGRLDYAELTYLKARQKTGTRTLYFNELVALYQQAGRYEQMTAEYFDLLDKQSGMMQSVQISMQRAMNDAPDSRLSDGIRHELVARVQAKPDNKTYLQMMIWFALQQQDFAFALEQAQAVDGRFAEVGGEQVMQVAQIARGAGALDVAAEAYAYMVAKGPQNVHYFDSRTGWLQVEYERLKDDSTALLQLGAQYLDALGELGRNEQTIPLMRDYASLMAYHGGDPQAAVDMLDDVLAMPKLRPSVRDEVKLELGDMLLFVGQTWDASLLYMQVDKANRDDVVGAKAKYCNARLSYFNHDFEWATSQLKVLRASTSKLIANDAMELSLLISDNMEDDSTYTGLELFADADLLLYRGMLDEAWRGFEVVAQRNLTHPLLDEVLMRKADIRTRQHRYAEADSLLQRVVDFYPYDITADDALMQMGLLNEEHLDNATKAIECYEKLIVDYPASLYVDQARKRYNALKKKQ